MSSTPTPSPSMRKHACLILLCVLGIAGRAPADDWPQWLGPRRNGVSTETVAPWTGEPKIAWKQKVGQGFSTPVVADNRVFVHAAVADKDAERVTAFDATTGAELWSDEYARPPYRSELGAGPRATPTVHNGRLYTIGITGVLSCYDAKTGERIWQTNPFDELNATRPGFGVCSSPLVVDDRVILPVGGEGSGVVGLDAGTGKIAWKILDEPAAAASPILIQAAIGESPARVVVQTTLRLACIDPADGAIHWEHPLVFQPSGVSPTPLVVAGMLVCSTQDNGTLTLKLPAAGSDAPAVQWWNQDVASYFSSGTVLPNKQALIITNSIQPLPRADLRCFDVETGDELWGKTGLGYFHFGVIALADGKLLILNDAGQLTLAEIGPDGYQELCKAKVCDGTFCSPVLADRRVYARDASQLVCIELRSESTADSAAASASGSGEGG